MNFGETSTENSLLDKAKRVKLYHKVPVLVLMGTFSEGILKKHWNPNELADIFQFSPEEAEVLQKKSGPNLIGFSLLLKFYVVEGRFPISKEEIPTDFIEFGASKSAVDPALFDEYAFSGRTFEYHRAQIRDLADFRQFNNNDFDSSVEILLPEALTGNEEYLKGFLSHYLQEGRIEQPSPERVKRIIRSAITKSEEFLFHEIDLSPGEDVKKGLALLLEDAGQILSLKRDPGRPGLDGVLVEVEKLEAIRSHQLPENLFSDIPNKLLNQYSQRVMAEPPREVKRHPKPKRNTLLTAFLTVRGRDITDNLVELLIHTIHRIGARAEKKVVKEILREVRKISGKTTILFKIAEAAVENPEGVVKDVLFPVVKEQTLVDLVKEYKTTGPAYRFHVYSFMKSSYHHYRRMVPKFLGALSFRSKNENHQPVIKALDLLRKYADTKVQFYSEVEEIPIKGVVPGTWEDLVIDDEDRVKRIPYELCVLQALRDGLRCKEIWVEGANRFRNPDDDLPTDFDEKRNAYYSALKQPLEAEAFIKGIQGSLIKALEGFARDLPKNEDVKVSKKGRGRIILTPLVPQEEPKNLANLKADIAKIWPLTSLLDILKETDFQVSFTDCFQSSGNREILEKGTLRKRLLWCIYGLGTSLGIKRISAGDHGENLKDLMYVRRIFITKENLRRAIAQVVNGIFRIRQTHVWGEGTTACASDSKKFGAWDQNLMTEWHQRYGGPGIMIYWHVERKASCIYSQLKRCSSSEVASMIEGVLRHCTEMEVDKQYVDTHGQSHVAFAFCYLLGFKLLPRIKGIHRQKLYRPEKGETEAYPNLEGVLTRHIKWGLIREQYDQMIKFATALRLGTAETEAILRRFTRNNLQHPTYQGLVEMGKAVKTIFLCDYLGHEALRREIQEGLNIIELWNGVNDFILFGKSGEIATNRRDTQEITMLSLHLIQNCMAYINTLMIQEVLSTPEWNGKMTPVDFRALTPLIHGHVNPYGNFELDMDKRISFQDVN